MQNEESEVFTRDGEIVRINFTRRECLYLSSFLAKKDGRINEECLVSYGGILDAYGSGDTLSSIATRFKINAFSPRNSDTGGFLVCNAIVAAFKEMRSTEIEELPLISNHLAPFKKVATNVKNQCTQKCNRIKNRANYEIKGAKWDRDLQLDNLKVDSMREFRKLSKMLVWKKRKRRKRAVQL